MKQFIQSLTNEFLAEAKSSPMMFEDLAAMEHYMAESYDGRAFVEILQNADDAKSSSLTIFSCGTDFIIANNGRPFNQEDIIAICRSGASSKQRGSGIGYRGIGFKSATSISTEIIIYSSGTYFTFSKSRCARNMNISVDCVPTVRIPFLVDEDSIDEVLQSAICKYEKEGYTTFFIFKDGNRDKLIAELTDISSGWLLFLNNIERVSVNLAHLSKKVEIRRAHVNDKKYLLTDKENGQSWLVVYSHNSTALAFKYDNHIVPCENNEALFHCFLPTQDALGFPFKVNADFSTDPSRKHIIINDDDTKRSIENVAHLVVELLLDTSFENMPYLIELLATRSGISEASSFLDRQILSLLKTTRWIPLQAGTQVSATEYRIVPLWFDSNSRKIVWKYVNCLGMHEIKKDVLQNTPHLDDILLRCGCQTYGAAEYGAILRNIDAVAALKDAFLGRLWGYALRSVLYSPSSIASYFLKDRKGNLIIASNAQKSVDFSEDFCSGLTGVLNAEELVRVEKLDAFNGITAKKVEPKKKATSENKSDFQSKIEYSKWKTPIQNCMVSEQLLGRSPKDFSKKNYGYDIESLDKDGNIRYLSVKSVDTLGNAFVLSEKEYSFAEQHESNYGIYIIENSNPENNMLIEGFKTVRFEKRVKEWEWISGQYEVIRTIKEDDSLSIDSKFLKDFSLKYLNKIQIAFLKTLCGGEDISTFESEFSCKASIIMMQVNGIFDFYIGDVLIENNLTVKSQYIGALKYMLEQEKF